MSTELEVLREQLHAKEKQLEMAAGYGKQLLDNQSELLEQIQKQAEEHRVEIERLEQEKYSLQQKVEQKSHMEQNYVYEIENLNSMLKKQKQEFEERAEVDHQAELSKLKTQLSSLQADVDKLQLSEKQLQERCKEQERQLEESREQLNHKVSLLNETSSEEIAQLHSEVNSLQGEKLDLVSELRDHRDQVQQLLLEASTLRQQMESRQQELEERQCQVTSYYNALEKAREETQELKVEMDILRMESQNHKKKGNSLFAEVEDRRVEAEKELITMKVANDSLRKQHEALRQQAHKLKIQMAGLLQMSGGRADTEYVETLQTQLCQARAEVSQLTGKLHVFEKKEKTHADYLADFHGEYGKDTDSSYSDYLLSLLDCKQKELDKLQAEMRTKSLQLLSSRDSLMASERTVYSQSQQIDALQGHNMKLQVKLEELQVKYEPEKLKKIKVRKTNIERIPLAKPENDPLMKPDGDPSKSEKGASQVSDRENTPDNAKEVKSEVKSLAHNIVEKPVKNDDRKRPLSKNVSNVPPVVKVKESVPMKQFKSTKVRKVTISDDHEVFELSNPCVAIGDSNQGEEGNQGDGNQGRQRPKGRVSTKKCVKMTADSNLIQSDSNECKTQ